MLFVGGVDTRGHLDPDARVQIADYLRTFPGMTVDVVIRKHRKQRSLDQNSYLHAEPFPKLAKAWGESVERTKFICMGQFWGWEPCAVKGVRVFLPVKAHTSDMTVEECTTFIDWLLPWALEEHGVSILLPDEWQAAEKAA
jgi:hypothetical protein